MTDQVRPNSTNPNTARSEDRSALPRGAGLGQKLALSWLALRLERSTLALWPLIAVVLAFLAVSWAGLWSVVSGWVHIALLPVFAVALVWSVMRLKRALETPQRETALQRLEHTGGLAHRPLTTVLDRPATGTDDAAALMLWNAHQKRMAARIAALRVAAPRPLLAAQDRYGLRVFVATLAVAGAIAAGDQLWPRLTAAFKPSFVVAQESTNTSLTAWIAQPDYTGLPPIFLSDQDAEQGGAVSVAVGSTLFVRLNGNNAASTNLRAGEVVHPFDRVDETAAEIAFVVENDGTLSVDKAGEILASWSVSVIVDRVPTVEPVLPIQQTGRGALKIDYTAHDDYGLDSVVAAFVPTDTPYKEPLVIDLPLSSSYPRESSEPSYHDLTPHPWAGTMVLMQLKASDRAGQKGESEPVALALPARDFNHPVARAIVDLRRRYATAPSAETDRDVREGIDTLSERPEEYGDDKVTYLTLRSIVHRMRFPLTGEERQGVIDLAWDAALRIEEGQVALAQEELRNAQEALQEALNRGADNEELQALMDRLEQAMNEYLDQLAQNPQDPPAGAEEPGRRDSSEQDRGDLEDMLERARDMAMTGAREDAQDMLEQLQEILENLQNPEQGSQMASEEEQQQQQQMEQLEQLMEEQEQILEDTFSQANNRRGDTNQGAPGQGDNRMSQSQEELRQALGELMREIGEGGADIPEELGKAERAMRDAREELDRGRPDRAIRPQAQALDRLRESAKILQNEMAQAQGSMAGQNNSEFNPEDRRDPLGRLPPGNEGDPNGRLDGPIESDLQKSREILDELYRRSSDSHRPQDEREYIERLLKWY